MYRRSSIPSLLVLGCGTLVAVADWLQPGGPSALHDGALFGYVGQRFAAGDLPYRTVLEVKPPLTQYVSGLLALLAPTPAVQYALMQLVTLAATVATVFLLARVVADGLEDDIAGVVAGLTLLTLPVFVTVVGYGFRPKPLVFASGLLAISLVDDRPLAAGLAAGASAALWQFGAVFGLLVLGRAGLKDGPRAAGRVLAALTAVAVAVTVPLALAGALNQMLAQVVVGPLVAGGEGRTVLEQITHGGRLAWPIAPLLIVGAVGAWRSLTVDGLWWVVPLASAAAIQTVFLDLDGAPDLMLGYLALAAAVAVVFHGLDAARLRVGLLLVLAVVGVTMGARAVDDPGFLGKPADSEARQELADAFWTEEDLNRCYVGQSRTEVQFREAVGGDRGDRLCGPYNLGELLGFSEGR